jgi:hypothetical protein
MDIEHFGFLSSVIRKTESHEQDGETLLREPGARSTTASGDPAMALLSSSVSAEGPFRPALFGSLSELPHNSGQSPLTTRAENECRARNA